MAYAVQSGEEEKGMVRRSWRPHEDKPDLRVYPADPQYPPPPLAGSPANGGPPAGASCRRSSNSDDPAVVVQAARQAAKALTMLYDARNI